MKKMYASVLYCVLSVAGFCCSMQLSAQPTVEVHKPSEADMKKHPKYAIYKDFDPGRPKFSFTLRDFPTNTPLILSTKRLAHGENYIRKCNFYVRDDGKIILGHNEERDCFIASNAMFLPGESVYFNFHTPEGVTISEIHLVPNEITAEDKAKTIRVTAELLSVDPTIYEMHVYGVQDGEEYKIKSISGAESIVTNNVYSSKEKIIVAPAIVGVLGGTATWELITKSRKSVKLKLPWGKIHNEYLNGTREF